MKHKHLKLILPTAYLTLLVMGNVLAQDGFDPPEIYGSCGQEYKELKIEITEIRRLQEYQAYFRDSDIPAGKKLVAGPEQEIALIKFRTERLGESPGIRLNGISILDSDGVEHKGSLGSAFIGTAGDRRAFHPKVLDYEFPVLVPKAIVFSTVQLRTSVQRDSQPYYVTQKINFDVECK